MALKNYSGKTIFSWTIDLRSSKTRRFCCVLDDFSRTIFFFYNFFFLGETRAFNFETKHNFNAIFRNDENRVRFALWISHGFDWVVVAIGDARFREKSQKKNDFEWRSFWILQYSSVPRDLRCLFYVYTVYVTIKL